MTVGSNRASAGAGERARKRRCPALSNCCSRLGKFFTCKMPSRYSNICRLRFWRAVAAEFIGTMFLVLIGCGSCLSLGDDAKTTTTRIALTFGLTVAILAFSIGNISGCHINPAVTLAMLVTRRVSVLRAILYFVVQFLGSLVGAAILYGLTPGKVQGDLGATTFSAVLFSPEQAFGIEFFITLLFVFVVFATCDLGKGPIGATGPLLAGLTITACHLYAVPLTGASMNTARTFGPALVKNKWANNWIYWFGPLLGGVTGGVLYDVLFDTRSSLRRARACLWDRDPDLGDPVKHDAETGTDEEASNLKKKRRSSIEEDPEVELPEVAYGEKVEGTVSAVSHA